MPAQPSVIDIAQRAGVSKSTAARALSGNGAVSDGAREKVFSAARALRYRPNIAARDLRQGQSKLPLAAFLAEISRQRSRRATR